MGYEFDAERTRFAIKDALDMVITEPDRVSALATRLLRDLVYLVNTDRLRMCEDKAVTAEVERATAFVSGHAQPRPGEHPHDHLQKLAYETRCMAVSYQLLTRDER
ncbi:hypothetical protein [Streptomyces alboflavus]|uniref:hypothetical protein n=1 Tax=Streptomyces alboflavus TaxID=67267 RepID=UPI000F6573A7|nr:hypothetical protein [Streptomyces alboflavus]